MEELNPPPLDPRQVDPGPGAEPIAALTFLLELPHCLRIEEIIFLVSDRGGSWPGWNPHAIGHMAGFARAAPEGDLRPRFKVHIRQTRIDGWVPLLAAEKAFPGWEEVERPQRPPGPTSRGKNELRSVVEITTYELADETPLGLDESNEARFRHAIVEWLSRRLDEALSFLNQYLVILAGMRDEWHTSALSRSDLPRDTPWQSTIHPTPAGWTGPSGTLDVHTTIRDDLPEERSAEEITYAVEAVHQARRGQAPFFQFVELYQAAEHHLGSGRHDQSVIAACTATEVLVNTLFRVLWICLEFEPAKLEGVLSAPFKNQLTGLLPKYIVGAAGRSRRQRDPSGTLVRGVLQAAQPDCSRRPEGERRRSLRRQGRDGRLRALDWPRAPGRPAYGVDQELSRFPSHDLIWLAGIEPILNIDSIWIRKGYWSTRQ